MKRKLLSFNCITYSFTNTLSGKLAN